MRAPRCQHQPKVPFRTPKSRLRTSDTTQGSPARSAGQCLTCFGEHSIQDRDNKTDLGQSGYIQTDVVHPHGILSTPRSLLFGIDAGDNYDQTREPSHKLKKLYWAQSNVRFRNHFSQANLFIIFGCSLGDSDGWWWRNIVRGLREQGESEVIIYRRQDDNAHTAQSIKQRFLDAAAVVATDPDCEALTDRIFVVIYEDDADRVFLNSRCHDQIPARGTLTSTGG